MNHPVPVFTKKQLTTLSWLFLLTISIAKGTNAYSPNPCGAGKQCAVDTENKDAYTSSCNDGLSTRCSAQTSLNWNVHFH